MVNSLGFEGWLDRPVEASGRDGLIVVATAGIEPRTGVEEEGAGEAKDVAGPAEGHGHGGTDPHARQRLAYARIDVADIAAGLAAVDPGGATSYAANAAAHMVQIDAPGTEIRIALDALAAERPPYSHQPRCLRPLYRRPRHGVRRPQGMGTGSVASAKDVAALVTQIRDEAIPDVFIENVADPPLLKQIMPRPAPPSAARFTRTRYSARTVPPSSISTRCATMSPR